LLCASSCATNAQSFDVWGSGLGLKNLIREKCTHLGQQSWTLITKEGIPVDAYRIFCEKLIGYPLATRKRYAEALSSFLDYLYEANVFGEKPVSAQYLNSVIDAYPLLLRDGSEAIAAKVRLQLKEAPHQLWLAEVAEALNLSPISANSFSNTLAPINRFLKLSEILSQEEFERATALGVPHQGTSQSLINALSGASKLSTFEINRMRQNSMFGNVVKFVGKNIRRPNRIISKQVKGLSNERYLDFPIDSIKSLIDAATSWRDKTLWLLLAASGIRTSEAKNILIDDIDDLS
jgi:integrase